MSKRIVALVCIAALLMTLLAACGGKKQVMNGIEVEEQKIERDNTLKGFALLLTNKTSGDCNIAVSVKFLDANGNVVESYEKLVIDAVAKDTTVADVFRCSKDFASYTYNVTPEALYLYNPIDTNLKSEFIKNGDKGTVSVTNNGNAPASFVEYYVLYYKGGKLIGTDFGYCIDDNNEIKPGATVTDDGTIFSEPYDQAKLYVHGKTEMNP